MKSPNSRKPQRRAICVTLSSSRGRCPDKLPGGRGAGGLCAGSPWACNCGAGETYSATLLRCHIHRCRDVGRRDVGVRVLVDEYAMARRNKTGAVLAAAPRCWARSVWCWEHRGQHRRREIARDGPREDGSCVKSRIKTTVWRTWSMTSTRCWLASRRNGADDVSDTFCPRYEGPATGRW